eukprot:CAMPEP_0180825176 /NCGR_PEP_ID=MMETSP1038_2-20121128/72826_1 /TAXON_ID=632150 /ORGANISM="Azadinium spinosum, Strain 3D9" /LENGTH=79 /DNA_ID=CAMNT_0022867611 /DNA_START=191 /DNA_END=427 /DNA_ORIENTATION=+
MPDTRVFVAECLEQRPGVDPLSVPECASHCEETADRFASNDPNSIFKRPVDALHYGLTIGLTSKLARELQRSFKRGHPN